MVVVGVAALSETKIDLFTEGSLVVVATLLAIAVIYALIKYDSWRRRNMYV